jgi:hypothetical protein
MSWRLAPHSCASLAILARQVQEFAAILDGWMLMNATSFLQCAAIFSSKTWMLNAEQWHHNTTQQRKQPVHERGQELAPDNVCVMQQLLLVP